MPVYKHIVVVHKFGKKKLKFELILAKRKKIGGFLI
jgi:hypothetical protein